MKQRDTNDKSLEEQLKVKSSNKTDITFLKLLAKNKKPKNPFDEIRSVTYPMKETKLGADDV